MIVLFDQRRQRHVSVWGFTRHSTLYFNDRNVYNSISQVLSVAASCCQSSFRIRDSNRVTIRSNKHKNSQNTNQQQSQHPQRIKGMSPHPRQNSLLSTWTDGDDVNDEGEDHKVNSIVENNNKLVTNNTKKLFSIGIVADIQYAPIEDGHSYSGNKRFYRNALQSAKIAAQHFERTHDVNYVINLGDIVDGKCKTADGNELVVVKNGGSHHVSKSIQAVNDVLDALSFYKKGTLIHTYGNHCLYNMNRNMIQSKLNIPFVSEKSELLSNDIDDVNRDYMNNDGELVGYYSVLLQHNIRLVVLDSYDISVLQRCSKTSKKYQEAYQILMEHNTQNMKNGNENSPDGLLDLQRRYVAFNGGIGMEQIQWFRNILSSSRQHHEKVIVISHQPIHPDSCHPNCLVWNYQEVLDIMDSYNDIVLASFAGHAHKGGYCVQNNIHYKVVEAILENIPPTYLIVDIYHNYDILVRGYGNCPSQVWASGHDRSITTTEATTTQEKNFPSKSIDVMG